MSLSAIIVVNRPLPIRNDPPVRVKVVGTCFRNASANMIAKTGSR